MKMNIKSKLGYIAVAALILTLASCGHSNKKRAERVAQPRDSVVVIEEESVVVAVDSIVPDSIRK